MATDQNYHSLMEQIMKTLSSGDQGMKTFLEVLLNAVMKMEREQALGAGPYERSEERAGYANGYKDKTWNTRVGALELKVPQVRGISFYPQCLDKGSRSEKALKLAIAEMYLQGVSTRKVEAITQEMCGLSFTSTQVSRISQELDEEFDRFRGRLLGEIPFLFLDATYVKVRHQGSVISMACLIAYGIGTEGQRQILGVSMELSEAEIHWRNFLEGLIRRGLRGVEMITSDDHPGLKKVMKALFPSVPWQRCQFHLSQNAQSYAPKKELRGEIAETMRGIFGSSTLEHAKALARSEAERWSSRAPDFSRWLEENVEEGLTIYRYPRRMQKRLRTTNVLERVSRELKRRIRVAVMFPNRESALRLITGVLIEIHEEWMTSRMYLNMEEDKAA